MEEIFNFLGFTSLTSTLWNLLAYAGMGLAITAVFLKKHPRLQGILFVAGPFPLFLYAHFFLHNIILSDLQLLITASGVMNLLKFRMRSWIVGIVTVITFANFLATDSISGIWTFIGSIGFCALGIGLSQLPKKISYVIMCLAGALLVIYSGPWALKIWVWFILNIFFFIANLFEIVFWKKE